MSNLAIALKKELIRNSGRHAPQPDDGYSKLAQAIIGLSLTDYIAFLDDLIEAKKQHDIRKEQFWDAMLGYVKEFFNSEWFDILNETNYSADDMIHMTLKNREQVIRIFKDYYLIEKNYSEV